MTSHVSIVSDFVANGHQILLHVSASPPTIPDSRITRVRFWPWSRSPCCLPNPPEA